jgi:Kdo2-lipid IVA lauroyltransferase/acyltransferase
MMYHVVYALLWLVSLLPLRFLYFLSDGIYLLVYYVFKYRREVVFNNLALAFPEKTTEEREKIAKKFYHNLLDTFIETIKLISASDRFIARRCDCNWETINQYYPKGKNLQIHLGHNFNWEWGNAALVKRTPYQMLVVYMPIASKIFDRLFLHLRSRKGVVLLPATNMRESFLPYRNTQHLLGLVADQNPGHPGNAWWVNFFGKPTPFVKGPAKAALTNNAVVLFAFIHKPRRGYYEGVVSVPDYDPSTITEQELTVKFVRYLENVIRQYPDMWLWSHRRWKWEWKPEYGEPLN